MPSPCLYGNAMQQQTQTSHTCCTSVLFSSATWRESFGEVVQYAKEHPVALDKLQAAASKAAAEREEREAAARLTKRRQQRQRDRKQLESRPVLQGSGLKQAQEALRQQQAAVKAAAAAEKQAALAAEELNKRAMHKGTPRSTATLTARSKRGTPRAAAAAAAGSTAGEAAAGSGGGSELSPTSRSLVPTEQSRAALAEAGLDRDSILAACHGLWELSCRDDLVDAVAEFVPQLCAVLSIAELSIAHEAAAGVLAQLAAHGEVVNRLLHTDMVRCLEVACVVEELMKEGAGDSLFMPRLIAIAMARLSSHMHGRGLLVAHESTQRLFHQLVACPLLDVHQPAILGLLECIKHNRSFYGGWLAEVTLEVLSDAAEAEAQSSRVLLAGAATCAALCLSKGGRKALRGDEAGPLLVCWFEVTQTALSGLDKDEAMSMQEKRERRADLTKALQMISLALWYNTTQDARNTQPQL